MSDLRKKSLQRFMSKLDVLVGVSAINESEYIEFAHILKNSHNYSENMERLRKELNDLTAHYNERCGVLQDTIDLIKEGRKPLLELLDLKEEKISDLKERVIQKTNDNIKLEETILVWKAAAEKKNVNGTRKRKRFHKVD